MDRDQLMNGNVDDIYKAGYSLLERIQDKSPAVQVQGLMVALSGITEVLGIDFRDLREASLNIIDDAQYGELKLHKAFVDYVRNELNGK
jgi:hypothetical protein